MGARATRARAAEHEPEGWSSRAVGARLLAGARVHVLDEALEARVLDLHGVAYAPPEVVRRGEEIDAIDVPEPVQKVDEVAVQARAPIPPGHSARIVLNGALDGLHGRRVIDHVGRGGREAAWIPRHATARVLQGQEVAQARRGYFGDR